MVDPQGAQIRSARLVFHRGQERRQVAHPYTGPRGDWDDLPDPPRPQRRNRDGHDIDPTVPNDSWETFQRTENGQPRSAALGGVVVEEADGEQSVVRHVAQVPGERATRGAGAHDQRAQSGTSLNGYRGES